MKGEEQRMYVNGFHDGALDYWLYECPPIDWWEGWWSVYHVADCIMDTDYTDWFETRLTTLAAAAGIAEWLIARNTRWEGDGVLRMTALPIPEHGTTEWLFAVKQNNNGDTFLCSPVPLTWLRESCEERHITAAGMDVDLVQWLRHIGSENIDLFPDYQHRTAELDLNGDNIAQ